LSYSYEYALEAAPSQRPGEYSEEMFFEGDQSALNPMRYLPTPFHTKFAQQRTALSQYIQQESVGTRMRRWERPFHDFLMPYLRGTAERLTGQNVIPAEVRHRRDLDTLADMMTYLRGLQGPAKTRSLPARSI
jgi:hypothetical protein